MCIFFIVGFILLLASIVIVMDIASMLGREETIMQQQYTMMNMLLAGLSFIGAFVMFGIGAVLSAISNLNCSVAASTQLQAAQDRQGEKMPKDQHQGLPDEVELNSP